MATAAEGSSGQVAMAHDVFISYSSKDKPVADAACAALEAAGIRCWIAPRDIMPSMEWGEAIVDAIAGCRLMLLVFSQSANESPQIRREVERAVNKGVPVLPLRIEDVAPTKSLEYFMGTVHWLDALTPPLQEHLQRLTQAVSALLQIDIAARPAPAPPTPGEPVPSAAPSVRREANAGPSAAAVRTRRPRAIVIGVAVVAVVVGLGVAAVWRMSDRPVEPPVATAMPVPAPAARVTASVAGGFPVFVGQTFRDCPDCPEMVVIPVGDFLMGSDEASSEAPIHRVQVGQPLAVGKFHVTRGEYGRFVRETGGRGDTSWQQTGFAQDDRHPAVNVSWEDAQAYAQWLARKTGRGYRLPTEAEWEYAARAGTTTRYSWGNDIGRGNAVCDGCGSQWDDKSTAPVGSFSPNPFGLHDMHGNAWQWV
ncbi:MAG: SUMF1/EgtB/PvdO family nonheme iron enzyme, partial [Proteobacteria bacterium]|nr:SUMF1/EgtB/PvdO family nonheme iron enzyme [Pseudomonadota bacterium]